MIQFKVGDRVRAVRDIDNSYKTTGKVGIIIDSFENPVVGSYHIALAFKDNVKGHTCADKCQDGHGLYAYNNDVELNERKVSVTDITFTSYQTQTNRTAVYPKNTPNAWVYPALGLSAEVGELQNKLKKILRDGVWPSDNDLRDELGDILWYLSQLTSELNFNLDDVAHNNLNKLKARQLGNKIHGEGDSR